MQLVMQPYVTSESGEVSIVYLLWLVLEIETIKKLGTTVSIL